MSFLEILRRPGVRASSAWIVLVSHEPFGKSGETATKIGVAEEKISVAATAALQEARVRGLKGASIVQLTRVVL